MAARTKAARKTAARRAQRPIRLRSNPYVQRLIEDAELRDNVRSAFDSARKAYKRMQNGKGPAKALVEDSKLQQRAARNRGLAPSRQASSPAASGGAATPRRQAVRARDPGRHRGPDPFRGGAQGRARPDLRRRGGVRVHLEHRSARSRAELAAEGLCISTPRAPGCGALGRSGTESRDLEDGALEQLGFAPPLAHSVEILLPAQRYVFALEDGHGRARAGLDAPPTASTPTRGSRRRARSRG